VLNNPDEAGRCELWRLQGVERFTDGSLDATLAGGKHNLTDIAACIGLGQLPHLEEFTQRRRAGWRAATSSASIALWAASCRSRNSRTATGTCFRSCCPRASSAAISYAPCMPPASAWACTIRRFICSRCIAAWASGRAICRTPSASAAASHAAAVPGDARAGRGSGVRAAARALCSAMSSAKPDLSVVIPVYNEEAVLPALFARLYPALDALARSYEIVFVNDGSRDRSAALLKAQFELRPDVTRVVLFAANFGQHRAILAGFARAAGPA
jgi:hypothetical protein